MRARKGGNAACLHQRSGWHAMRMHPGGQWQQRHPVELLSMRMPVCGSPGDASKPPSGTPVNPARHAHLSCACPLKTGTEVRVIRKLDHN